MKGSIDVAEKLQVWSRWGIAAMVLALPVVLFYASGMRIGSASANSWLPEGWPDRGRYERF